MAEITASVGDGGVNVQADVDAVRGLLLRHRRWIGRGTTLASAGPADAALTAAIRSFQLGACAYPAADGRVDPGGFTLRRLNLQVISPPRHPVFQAPPSRGGDTLSNADFARAAQALGCEAAAIKAVAEVEAGTIGAWFSDGRPTILYEKHIFRDQTRNAYSRTHPDLSGPYQPGTYGGSAAQYPKLRRAAVLDEDAALKSCSWGKFQIMGFNHVTTGHVTVVDFVRDMNHSSGRQLDAFVAFIAADADLASAIRAKDWARFARGYNGPAYRTNQYDTKMAAAYARYAASPALVP
jgi:hypothetical protein